MSGVPLFGERAIQIIADDKIAAALAAGEFDKLPGLGRPHPIFDEPYDPDWWVRRRLRELPRPDPSPR